MRPVAVSPPTAVPLPTAHHSRHCGARRAEAISSTLSVLDLDRLEPHRVGQPVVAFRVTFGQFPSLLPVLDQRLEDFAPPVRRTKNPRSAA